MWLIAGLGNPGAKYERNRHTIGFRVVDELARGMPALRDNKLGSESTTGMIAGTKVALVKPMEFLNLSGFAIQRASRFHDADPAHLIVIHDEIDLDFGIVRLKNGGGHGGHNGLRLRSWSSWAAVTSVRLRMGVGYRDPNTRPGSKDAATLGPRGISEGSARRSSPP